MVSGYDLRINLSYFIGKSYEKEIMNKINEVSQKYTGFDVRLFYSEQDNLTSKLKDFAKRYDGKVNFKKTMKNLKMNYLILVVGFINLTASIKIIC